MIRYLWLRILYSTSHVLVGLDFELRISVLGFKVTGSGFWDIAFSARVVLFRDEGLPLLDFSSAW